MFGQSILVKLGLNSSQFNQGLSASQRRTERFSKTVTGAFARIVGPILAIGTVTALGRAAMELGDKIDTAAQKTGLGVEEFQKLGYAARQNKSNIEDLEKGLVELNKRIESSPAMFEKYGIALTDVNGVQKSTTQILAEVSDRMKNAATQAERTAIANDLMSRSGINLIPMLQQGSEYLGEMGIKAEELGQVMSEDTIAALAEATQAIDDFKTAATVAFGQAISGANDLWKTIRGKGLNDQHQGLKDLQEQAERDVIHGQGLGDFSARHKLSGGRFKTDADKAREEAIEKRLGELTRERLEAQKAVNERKDEEAIIAEEQRKVEEEQAEVAKDREKEEARINEQKRLQEVYAEGARKREIEALEPAKRILEYQKQIADLWKQTEDSNLSLKERERIVANILSLEDKISGLQEEEKPETVAEAAKRDEGTVKDFMGKSHDVAELRKNLAEDEEGRTVAGRNAKRLLTQHGLLDQSSLEPPKEENYDKDQLTTLKDIERALKGKFLNQ